MGKGKRRREKEVGGMFMCVFRNEGEGLRGRSYLYEDRALGIHSFSKLNKWLLAC